MQCYTSTLPSTILLRKSSANYQYIPQHSKPQCYEYVISRIQNMATFRGPLEQDPATSLGQHTISSYWSTVKHTINCNRPIILLLLFLVLTCQISAPDLYENHDMWMKWEPTWPEIWQKHSQKHFLHLDHWTKLQNPGNMMYKFLGKIGISQFWQQY